MSETLILATKIMGVFAFGMGLIFLCVWILMKIMGE